MITLRYEDINWELETESIKLAEQLFYKGFNCCQSVFTAFSGRFGLDMDFSLKISCSHGAGIGRMREVCGTFSGIALIISLYNGNTDPDNTIAKTENYKTIRMLADIFKQRHGTIICKELLNLRSTEISAKPDDRTKEYYATRPCPRIVHDAAVILEHYLQLND